MKYIEDARKKWPKEKVQFMIGGAVEALKKFSGLNIPGIPAVSDLTDKIGELQSIASAVKSGATEQLKAAARSGLSTKLDKITDAAATAKNVGGNVSGLDDTVKKKLDEASTMASSITSPQKLQDLAGKAQELMGALSATGMLKDAAQKFLGKKFVNPILKPLAGKMVDAQKVWELPSQYKAEYPHNKVTSTPSGHTVQMDDTPGNERLAVHDKHGNYVEFGKDGVNMVAMTKLNITTKSASPGGEFSLRIKSKCDIHVDGDANIKVTGDMDGEVEGSSTMLVKGDAGIVVKGDSSMLVKGDAGIHVAGEASIHADGNMGLKTEGDMTFESAGSMKIKSGGPMNIEASGNMTQKAPKIDLNP